MGITKKKMEILNKIQLHYRLNTFPADIILLNFNKNFIVNNPIAHKRNMVTAIVDQKF